MVKIGDDEELRGLCDELLETYNKIFDLSEKSGELGCLEISNNNMNQITSEFSHKLTKLKGMITNDNKYRRYP